VSPASPNPYVFLVGSARSGTTLLRRIVNAHPAIAITRETHFVPRWYVRRRGLTPDGHVTPKLLEHLAGYHRFRRFGLPLEDLERLARTEPPVTYAQFLTAFYDLHGQKEGKPLVGDKTGEYSRWLPTLHGLWPDARFIHLIRDGRDVCLSVLSWREEPGASRFSTWSSDRVSTCALWWMRNVALAQEAGASLGDLYHEVRYEELVNQPERVCKEICAFLDLPYDDSMLRFHEGRTRIEPGLTAKQAWLPITPGLRDWATQMPDADVERFEAAVGEFLDELGYPRRFPELSEESVEHAAAIRAAFEEDVRRRRSPLPAASGR
jgi:Sulfotransferase family